MAVDSVTELRVAIGDVFCPGGLMLYIGASQIGRGSRTNPQR